MTLIKFMIILSLYHLAGPKPCIVYSRDSIYHTLSVAGGTFILTSLIFCTYGCLCGCCCLCCCQNCRSRRHRSSLQNNAFDKIVQVPSPQIKRPKPPRFPPPIYEYVPSTRPSDKAKEQNIEMKASKHEEQCLEMPKVSEGEEQDLKSDIKLTMNEGQNLEVKSAKSDIRQDLETIENIVYCPTQIIKLSTS